MPNGDARRHAEHLPRWSVNIFGNGRGSQWKRQRQRGLCAAPRAGRRLASPAQTIRAVNSITARFTNTLIIGRSSRCWRKTLNTPASPAASRRSSKRCPSLVRTTSSPQVRAIAVGRRFHRPCPAHRAGKETSPPARQHSSFPPSATIISATKNCSASCSPMIP